MTRRFPERGPLDLPGIAKEVMQQWEDGDVFRRSVATRPSERRFVFFEGPPSANGKPGIHHVMARALKDIFCRYRTLKGERVERKAGWDTHGLPVELGVEKALGITKEDIGRKISVEEYNRACRESVMRYTEEWNDLTRQMGYWVDMDAPYVTYEPKYMESVWWLLSQLHEKGLIYKGYTIQPYSPKAGTGLSSHELNQPGAYRDVTDTTVVAQFRLLPEDADKVRQWTNGAADALPVDLLAWTTTPWTLPSNTALTVGAKIDYHIVRTANRYTEEAGIVVLASALFDKHFGGKKAPESEVLATVKGADLVGLRYEQLIPWAQPMEQAHEAFRVIPGDFVTTEDGTGIVHTAPTFGADDARVAQAAGVPPLLVDDGQGNGVPLVDLQGRLRPECGPLAGRFVKQEYHDGDAPERSVDVEIAIDLKTRGRAFLVEKYKHSYPHCWRTDRPVLYYPLDSWFIRATAAKDRMQALNETIQWKPAATGSGRFGKWLENLNDWNLSRSRYWGIPIPIWRTEDGSEERCIGSVEDLHKACTEAVEAGLMDAHPFPDFVPGDMSDDNYAHVDLHKHVVDGIVLKAADGRPMHRESDLIDVWFDSGSMPYAQWHYPFENKERIDGPDGGLSFPADFIAEGVDQTRGWFYTLHAISTMVFDQVAYRTVVSNGLVLDKDGQKMSKRLGNAVDPFETLERFGPDATRWYMITNAQPWDNLRFDTEGIAEVQRKFFGTLHNTYAFFALYAGIDGFNPEGGAPSTAERCELDRWILSRLHTCIAEVQEAFDAFEPTKAGRLVQSFVVDDLSNWYVRLGRRRFWKSDSDADKSAAYATLHTCLKSVSVLMSPIAPFHADRLWQDLGGADSVHLADWPVVDPQLQDAELEARMGLAQKLSSLTLSLRKREKIRVRQPLKRILVPVLDARFGDRLAAVAELVKGEVNVKSVEPLAEDSGILTKKLKADFKKLGPRFGKRMKEVAAGIAAMGQEDIRALEQNGAVTLGLSDGPVEVMLDDVEVLTEDIPGWLVAGEGGLTVALDIEITPELRAEGLARELVNRIQQRRKDAGLEVTDRIALTLDGPAELQESVASNLDYIRTETLAEQMEWAPLGAEVEREELEPQLTVAMAMVPIR
ncbi:MAG: isoleucine--tRNA ligase [Flavobacteriales bacterium]|nr:isoleucine--tRNA ligase [Flavobacteriales bacterium]